MSRAFLGLAGALLCAAPALAQTSAPAATTPPPATPPAEEAIGPPQIRGFSLNGTVTRRAEPQPPPGQPSAETPPPAPRPVATAPQRESAAPRAQAQAAPAAPARAAEQAPSAAPVLEFGQPTPARIPPVAFPSSGLAPEPASAAPIGSFSTTTEESGGGLPSLLLWLIALLAAAGAAVWYFRRQREDLALAGAGAGAGADASAFDLSPPPEPAAKPRTPIPPAAAPQPPVPAGIVSTRLRPWLDISFVPESAEISEERAVIHFEVAVFNSGSAPARDLVIEAVPFNAGPDQDEAIEAFFKRPPVQSDPIGLLGPLGRLAFRHSVTMTRDQMRIFEVGGRRLFVPLIGFNARYSWSGGKGQTSASYLLGRDTDGEKMAPFRVDLGTRTYRPLAAREHALTVRK